MVSAIGDAIERGRTRLDVVIPYQAGKVYSELNDKQYIESERTGEIGWELRLRLPQADADTYQPFAADRFAIGMTPRPA